MNTESIDKIRSLLKENFVPNGAYFPVLHLKLEGNSDLEAVHDYGDHDSYKVWEGELTREEMIFLMKAKFCQTRLE